MLKYLCRLLIIFSFFSCGGGPSEKNKSNTKRPNIILVMADDLGWGDVGYNGNKIVKTPNLDLMASQGVRLDRFYAAAPVCSPTRASCLTGRNSYRYGIFWADVGSDAGHLRSQEITLAEMLKENGYKTGLFGKWHIGRFSKDGEEDQKHYSPPWENGFDISYSTESLVPLYNPTQWNGGKFADPAPKDYKMIMDRPLAFGEKADDNYPWHIRYWSSTGSKAKQIDTDLPGDDSKIIMDKAVEFIETNSADPFLSVIWLHAPHTPIATGNEHRLLYPDLSIKEQHWYGSISSIDEQIGRLRNKLKELGIADNTIVWFCSDNGPSYVHDYNSAGPYRGKKGTLYEGGIRVPSIVEWPKKIPAAQIVNAPVSTSDFYPTLLAAAKINLKEKQPVLDGINVLDILNGEKRTRDAPIAFQSPVKSALSSAMVAGSKQLALCDERYKLFSGNNGQTYQLYDLIEDPSEKNDIASKFPQIVIKMRKYLDEWVSSCEKSLNGKDY